MTLIPLVFALLHAPGIMPPSQRWTTLYDQPTARVHAAPMDDRIVTVDIDEKSLAEAGRFRGRDKLADLLISCFSSRKRCPGWL